VKGSHGTRHELESKRIAISKASVRFGGYPRDLKRQRQINDNYTDDQKKILVSSLYFHFITK
jgi:hypothetical protein